MRAAAVLVAALVLAAACGRKSPPIAPELVQPEPVGNLAAVGTADGVRLSWLRPDQYSGGQRMNDLGGFVVERRAEGTPAFARVATIEVQDQTRFRKDRHLEWVDRGAEAGTHYFYRVTAYTLDGYRSPPAGPVAALAGGAGEPDPPEPPKGPAR